MSAAWVAGAIRGRALAARGLGDEALERLGSQPSFADALGFLAASTYGHALEPGMDLDGAQRAVGRTALWHLRVLAGWLPPRGILVARAIAGWWEIQNLEALSASLAGSRTPNAAPYSMGALAVVWGRASTIGSSRELRGVLARSEWGDPGGERLSDVVLGVHLGWARLLHRAIPERPHWGAGGLALVVAKSRFLEGGGGLNGTEGLRRVPELGTRWEGAGDLRTFTASIPEQARWVVRDLDGPSELWRSEQIWWSRVASDASAMLRQGFPGRSVLVGAATTLLTDCWRVRTALARATRAQGRGAARVERTTATPGPVPGVEERGLHGAP